MACRVIWSPRAASHLEEICAHIAQDSPMYARIFARRVISVVRDIPRFPMVGRMVPEYGNPGLRERLHAGYRIVYRVKPDTLEIAAICHGARLLKNAMPAE